MMTKTGTDGKILKQVFKHLAINKILWLEITVLCQLWLVNYDSQIAMLTLMLHVKLYSLLDKKGCK